MTTGNLTIQDNDTVVQYTSVGESTFVFSFPILAASELKVSRNQVVLTYGTDYSITGIGDDGGGYITLLLGASTPGDLWSLWQDMPIERLTGFSAGAATILGSALNAEFAARLRVEQQLRREIRNSLRLSPDDPIGGQDMVLSAATGRAGKYLAFDALGKPIASAGTGGGDAALRTDLASTVVANDGSRIVGFKQNAAGATARTVNAKLRRLIDIEDFGAIVDGASNDYAAWTNALAYIATLTKGADIRIPEGVSAISSVSLAALSLALPNRVRIIGEGADRSQILVTGATPCNLFSGLNKTAISLLGVTLRGNGIGSGTTLGMAFDFAQSVAAVAAGERFRMIDLGLENFGGDSWFRFSNTSATYTLGDIILEPSHVKSEAGNSRTPGSLAVASDVFVFQGQPSVGAVGFVEDVAIRGGKLECTFVKNGVTFWHSTRRCYVTDTEVLNSGVTGAADNCAGYAFKVYNLAGTDPDLVEFNNVKAFEPRSIGIYCATVNRLKVNGGYFTGQTDTVDATLPKCAIALNGATVGEVNSPTIDNCYGGVVLVGATPNDELICRAPTIRNVRATGFGVRLYSSMSAGPNKVKSLMLTDPNIDASGATSIGVQVIASSANGIASMIIKGGRIRATQACILFTTTAGVIDLAFAQIGGDGMTLVGNGATYGMYAGALTDAETRLRILPITYQGTWAANANLLDIASSLGVNIDPQIFQDGTGLTTGACIYTDGTRGNIARCFFPGVVAARRFRAGASRLGIDTPNWPGDLGQYIVNLNADAADGNNMTIDGWRNTTGLSVWNTQRMSNVSPAT